MWSDLDLSISRVALWTESAAPLPPVPANKFCNTEALNTISNHPNLFKIIMPINIPSFKELLTDHPHQPFVDSVIHDLTIGFWPYAHTHYGSYPTTHNDSGTPPKTVQQADFLRKQIQTEFEANRYLAPFGPELLSGMYSTPFLTVPKKPGSDKLCLCNHQSHGDFSLNSMIKREDISRVMLDGIRELGESIYLYRHHCGNVQLVIFESDMTAA